MKYIIMSSVLDLHGGKNPSIFHTKTYSDVENKVYLVIKPDSNFSIDLVLNLPMNKIAHIFIVVSGEINTQNVHPIITFINKEIDIDNFLKINILKDEEHIFYTVIRNNVFIHSQFWELLETAKPGTNIHYLDENNTEYILYSLSKDGIGKKDYEWPLIAAYGNHKDNKQINEQIKYTVQNSINRKNSKRISEMIIDTSETYTPLCYLATKYMTDKSPYNLMTHRHPYTAVYDMFFRPLQNNDTLNFGEVGILNGASMRMWREYFPNAYLHGFDINHQYLEHMNNIKNSKGYLVDVGDGLGLRNSLMDATSGGKLFDVLLDDASHRPDHQLIFIRDGIDFIRPGGMLIVEDIFREVPLNRFQEAVDQISDKVHNAVMIIPEHKYRFSPGWENDRILIIWRK
jgi:hypothetical protein